MTVGGRHSTSATLSVLAANVGQELQGLGDAHDWEWPLDWGLSPFCGVVPQWWDILGFATKEQEVGLML